MLNNSSTVDLDDGLNYILLFRLIVWGYVGIVLSVFGIFGNIITILVLTSPSMRTTSTNIYLTALSCSNIVFLLIFIPSYSVRYLLGYRLYITNQPPFAFEILLTRLPTSPIYNTILLSIIYLTIAVSMDRLILVKFPLKAKQILTQRATLTTIFLIYLFCIIYCIPYWLEQRYDPEIKRCVLTTLGRKIKKFTRIYGYIPVVYLIPFVTLTFINVTIIQNLIANQQRKKKITAKNTNKKKQADYSITLMLVTVVIVFVLCQLPLLILNVWYAIDPVGSSESLLFLSLNSLGILLIVFNTSTNFLLYCFFGQKFRQTLIEFIFNCLPNHQKSNNLQTSLANLKNKPVVQPISMLLKTETKPRISSGNLTTTTVTNDVKKSVEMNNQSNPTTLPPPPLLIHQNEESTPLITPSEQTHVANEDLSLKFDQNFNLFTCADGKRIIVLKI